MGSYWLHRRPDAQSRILIRVPDKHLRAQIRHEQQRATVRCAERLVGDLDPVAGDNGGLHPVDSLSPRPRSACD
jgi:hypothetical protein